MVTDFFPRLLVLISFGISTLCYHVQAAEPSRDSQECDVAAKSSQTGAAGPLNVVTARFLALYPLPHQTHSATSVESHVLEVTVRPVWVTENAAFVVDAFVVDSCQREVGQLSGEKIGTFAFVPPPSKGEDRVFDLQIPSNLASTEYPMLALRLTRVGGDLADTALQVVGARYLD